MITPNDLKNIELKKADFEKLEEEIDESIKSFHASVFVCPKQI